MEGNNVQPERHEPVLGFHMQKIESIVGSRGMERYLRSKKRIEQEKAETGEEQEA